MIIVFGSINLDLIFPLPHLPQPGQTVLGPDMRIEPGGKGANQAVAAARDGAEDALRLLRAGSIDTARILHADRATGCAAICVDPQGRNLIAVASGANLAARHTQVEDALLGPETTVLLQMEVPAAETEALIRRARAAGARVVLNLAPAAPLAADALAMLDLLLANEDEAAFLAAGTGCPATAAALHAALGIGIVITLGEHGVDAATGQGAWRLPAAAIEAIDTTGAGDCFTGVLTAAIDRGQPLELALRRATAAAGLCCTRQGSQDLPKLRQR